MSVPPPFRKDENDPVMGHSDKSEESSMGRDPKPFVLPKPSWRDKNSEQEAKNLQNKNNASDSHQEQPVDSHQKQPVDSSQAQQTQDRESLDHKKEKTGKDKTVKRKVIVEVKESRSEEEELRIKEEGVLGVVPGFVDGFVDNPYVVGNKEVSLNSPVDLAFRQAQMKEVTQLIQALVSEMHIGELGETKFINMQLSADNRVPVAFSGSSVFISCEDNQLAVSFAHFKSLEQEQGALSLVNTNPEQLKSLMRALRAKQIFLTELSIGGHKVALPAAEPLLSPMDRAAHFQARERKEAQERSKRVGDATEEQSTDSREF